MLTCYLGAMEAGKSLELLVLAHKHEAKGLKVQTLTFEGDNRFGHGVVASRIGLSRQAKTFNTESNFETLLDRDFQVLMVDEAQFLTKEQVLWLHRLSTEKTVLCFGLRSTYKGEPFEGSAWLMALCDEYKELSTVCSCGSKATMNARFNQDGSRVKEGEVIAIGDSNYSSMCSRCFYN